MIINIHLLIFVNIFLKISFFSVPTEQTYGSVFSEDVAYRQLYQPVESFTYSTPVASPVSSPSMYDAALPYVYTNPALVRSSLQTIAEENNDEKQEKITEVSSLFLNRFF